jgi:hypothetical protein
MIEIDKECVGDIKQPELIPDGDVLVVEVADIPEVRNAKLCGEEVEGANYLNFRLVVNDQDSNFNGESGFHSVSIPNKTNKAKIYAKTQAGGKEAAEESILRELNKIRAKNAGDIPTTQGWKLVCANFDDMLHAFGLDKGNFDETKLAHKKVRAVFGRDSYQGKERNSIKRLLPLKAQTAPASF